MKTFKVMVAILIGVSLFFVGGISVANAAEVEVGAGENTITADISEQPITIAPNITLSNFGSNLSSSKIVVENLPESLVLRNVLSTSYSGGLSVVYDDNTNVCTITGSDSAANYEALLRTFTFDTGATYANNIKFNFIVAFDDNDAMYYSENGHYYEYVEEVNPISWTDANEAITDSSNGGVSRKTYNGMKGYMVTITSEGENNFVVEKMIGNSWIGASDVGAEDDWKWTTGPEANTSFWSGDENGSAVNGEYNNWGSGEPNDYGDGEDYAHIFINDSDESKIDGEWNDFKVDDDRVYGYVVEYGGMTGDTPTDLSETITVNIINTIVTLDTVSEGGLEAAAGAIVSDPTNVRELHIYSGALNDVEDINYINSLVNLEVLNVRGNVVVANAGDDFCKQTSTAFNDLREVTFPATTIGNYAFQGCNSLESIYFPNATSVGYGVAGSCNFLLYASFPKMTEAGSGFLSSCWDLTHVYLPKATTFAHSAFMGNYDLENIILPEATSFDFNAFAASPGAALAYVYMPNVGNIGNNAFSKCDSLTELHLGSAEPTLGGTLGEDGASTRYVLVPDATEYGGVGADWNGWTVGLYTNATITYDANGADSGTPPTDSSYAYNTTATIQANTDLAKSGLQFNGWNTMPNGTGAHYDAGDEFNIEYNIDLYAEWGPITYSVTYHGNGEDRGDVPTDDTDYAHNATVTVLGNTGTLEKDGYTFTGWNTASDYSGGDHYNAGNTYTIWADVNLYAQWEQQYVITVTANGNGTVTPSGTTVYVDNGSDQSFTFASNTGYEITDVTVDGTSVGTPSSYDFASVSANHTLEVTFGIISYTVDFDDNVSGETIAMPSDQTINHGGTATEPADPTRSGYRFAGWYKESGCTNAWDFASDTVTSATTLYAKWVQQYEITVTSNIGGTVTPSGTVKVDTGSDQNFVFTPNTGYEVTDVTVDSTSEDVLSSYNFTGVTADHTLEVTFGISSYTVDFNDNVSDETIDMPSNQTINHGGTVTEPSDPTRNHYTFGGWYKEEGCTNAWDFANDTISSNTTIYAKWTSVRYTVTYNKNGATDGTAPYDDNSPYAYNAEVTVFGNAGLLTKTGYSFDGWDTASDGTGTHYDGTDKFNIAANTVLYAQWKTETYKVTYNKNGATSGSVPSDENSPYEYNTEVTVLGNIGSLAKTGYTFEGWDTKADGSGTSYDGGDKFDIAANTILYVEWTPVTATVTLDKQSGINGTGSVEVTYGSAMPSVAAPSRTGYVFGGYYTEKNGSGTQYYDADMKSAKASDFLIATTLYAKWTIKTYTLTYNSNGGTSGAVPTDSNSPYDYNTQATILDNTGSFSKTGHDFAGWNTESDGSGTDYDANDKLAITSDTILYAQWTVASYNVTYHSNSASSGAVPTDSNSPYIYNTEVTVLSNSGSLTRTGYTFDGWNSKADGSGTSYSTSATFNIASDTILYAKWAGNQYSITLDKQSGSGGSDSVAATYGSPMPSASAPKRAGYTFGGYYTAVNGGGTKYYNADMSSALEYNDTSAKTLYAKWTQDKYIVTYNTNGATGGSVPTDSSSPYTYYQTVTVLGNTGSLVREDYTFIGWNTTSTGSGTHYEAGDTFAIYESAILYAEWKANAAKVDLTYNTNDATSGSAPTDSSSPYTVGSKVTVVGNTGSLKRTGCTFEGWNTKSDGSGTNYESGDTFTINTEITLYAKWTANEYKVTFDKRYGSGGTNSVTATYDSAMPSASAPSRSGYSFGGYYTEKNGNGTRYYNYKMTSTRDCDFTKAITLYAKWTTSSSGSSGTSDDDEDSVTTYASQDDEDKIDTDGDGVSDEAEEEAGSEPDNAESTPSDIDGNGVVDKPFADTDNDNIMDGDEVKYGSDPDNPESTPSDVDGNGVVDDPYVDTDKDGVTDGDEAKAGSDPDNADSVPSDINGDGVVDSPGADTDNDGMSDSLEITLGSDPYDGKSTPLDMNGDGIVDKPFADSDGDGVSDSIEVALGSNPYDEKSAPPEKDSNAAGGLSEVDSDNDGISDRAERAVGSDPADSNDKPNIGTVTGKIINASKAGMQGVKLILYSTPKEVTTDANGEFNFKDVSLSAHTLSIYMKDVEVGRYELEFNSANENAIRIDDDASSDGAGKIKVSTNSDLALVEVVLQQNENGLFEVSDADFEASKGNQSNSNNRLLLWIIIISVILLGGLVYLLIMLRRRSKYYD